MNNTNTSNNNINPILLASIIKYAARTIHQSYSTITTEHAFYMAVGEAEVQFNTDLDIKLTEEIRGRIEEIVNGDKVNAVLI